MGPLKWFVHGTHIRAHTPKRMATCRFYTGPSRTGARIENTNIPHANKFQNESLGIRPLYAYANCQLCWQALGFRHGMRLSGDVSVCERVQVPYPAKLKNNINPLQNSKMNLLEFDDVTLAQIVNYVGKPWAFVMACVCRAMYLFVKGSKFRTPRWTAVVSVPMLQF